ASEQGKGLLAHELVHVAQQTKPKETNGHANGHTNGAPGRVTEPGSAVEREAQNIAHQVVRGGAPAKVEQHLPEGTIARGNEGAAAPAGAEGGGLTGNWDVCFLGQQIHADLATATDFSGRKKLTLNIPKIGPVRLEELTIEVDGTSVSRGFL